MVISKAPQDLTNHPSWLVFFVLVELQNDKMIVERVGSPNPREARPAPEWPVVAAIAPHVAHARAFDGASLLHATGYHRAIVELNRHADHGS